jgi:hypothetical protein
MSPSGHKRSASARASVPVIGATRTDRVAQFAAERSFGAMNDASVAVD